MKRIQKQECVVCQKEYLTKHEDSGTGVIRPSNIRKRGTVTCGNKKCYDTYVRIYKLIYNRQRGKKWLLMKNIDV